MSEITTQASENPRAVDEAVAERVQVEVSEAVATVTLSRPEKHNALDWAMFKALEGAAASLSGRKDVRAVVLRGEGPSFCSGLDFPSFIEAGIPVERMLEPREGAFPNLAQGVALDWQALEVPVIAALTGVCYGGGAQIALGADMRIAAPDTRISIMEIKWGLIPDMGITRTLPRLVAIDVAKELTFTGRVVAAPEALELGLVTSIADDPHAAALELAERIATRSPHAIRAGKRLLDRSWVAPAGETLELEAELNRSLLGSPNQIAAVTAGLSKQDPSFTDPD